MNDFAKLTNSVTGVLEGKNKPTILIELEPKSVVISTSIVFVMLVALALIKAELTKGA